MARSNPDLNFNKGVALLYEEDYPAALASFDRASALEPDWEKPQVKSQMQSIMSGVETTL